MKTRSWDNWLRGWLTRHPLKDPPEELRWNYRRQVMDRIRPQQIWVFRPRPAFGWAGALAAALAVAVLMVRVPQRIVVADAAAEEALEIWNELEAVGQTPIEEPAPSDETLEEELRQLDQSELAIS